MVGEECRRGLDRAATLDLVVRLQDDRRSDAGALRNLLLDGHDGTRIPLAQVASIEQTVRAGVDATRSGEPADRGRGERLGPRPRQRRRMTCASASTERLQLPAGYFFDVGGRVESQERATRALVVASRSRLLAVFVLLYLALGSFAESLVILATLPDAFVGGILALLHRRGDVERLVARRADRIVRHRGPERPRARHADARPGRGGPSLRGGAARGQHRTRAPEAHDRGDGHPRPPAAPRPPRCTAPRSSDRSRS